MVNLNQLVTSRTQKIPKRKEKTNLGVSVQSSANSLLLYPRLIHQLEAQSENEIAELHLVEARHRRRNPLVLRRPSQPNLSSIAVIVFAIGMGFYTIRKIKKADVIEAWELDVGPHRFS
ncbi:hypothetical protein U1Q18_024791 [Sarracenia purpurea var. burkii]